MSAKKVWSIPEGDLMSVLPNAEPAAGQVVGCGEGHQTFIPQVIHHLLLVAVVLAADCSAADLKWCQ